MTTELLRTPLGKQNRVAAQFAIVTGASTGNRNSRWPFECASHGYDLLIVADEPRDPRGCA